jgi:hypothetical protein
MNTNLKKVILLIIRASNSWKTLLNIQPSKKVSKLRNYIQIKGAVYQDLCLIYS